VRRQKLVRGAWVEPSPWHGSRGGSVFHRWRFPGQRRGEAEHL